MNMSVLYEVRTGKRLTFLKCNDCNSCWSNEPLSSIKCGELHDYLCNGQLFKKDSAAWSECVSK